jgi:RNA polymerase sigma-70 factor (ECF subfamily)
MRLRRRTPSAWNAAAPDDELVAWAQQGEREAFGLLYDRHFASIYGYCYRCLGEREAAQDAAAETFRKALVALPVYRPQAFRGWLFAIARNAIADARRRLLEVPLDDALMVPSSLDSLEETALVRADVATIVALLPQLTPDQHDAVALRLAGLTPAEIALVLGKSRSAVDMTLHRALLRLRELMTVGPETVAGGGRG